MRILKFCRDLVKDFFENQLKQIESKKANFIKKLDYKKLEQMAKDKTPKAMRVGNYYQQVERESKAGVMYTVLTHR